MDELRQLAEIRPGDRVLLLPHCLRHSNTCQASYNEDGLQCQGCDPHCSINRLRHAAIDCGYKGICVAPGGRLAIKFIQRELPEAIVAVACQKELEEGIQNVKGLDESSYDPLIVIVPLEKDGCVDTIVDENQALDTIVAGVLSPVKRSRR